MTSQPAVTKLAPELAKSVTDLARALVTAARNCTLYPPGHPALVASFERLSEAIDAATNHTLLAVAITPDTLLIDGLPVPASAAVAEAARLLHDCDLLQVTFCGAVPREALSTFLQLLAADRETVRQHGGPESIWSTRGHSSILLEQIDYATLLADTEHSTAYQHDDIWTSIVRSMVGGATVIDEAEQRRLLDIAAVPGAISDLIAALIATKCTADGAPMITSQAATIVAAYRHLATIVSVATPEQIAGVMENLASATSALDPQLILQILRVEDDPEEPVQLMTGLAAAFKDEQIAQLIAMALAANGQATAKLADVFNTVAPDRQRKRRVLKMAKRLLGDTSFGQSRQFDAVWNSMEELCAAYNEDPSVSDQYRSQLDGAAARGDLAAGKDLPDEMPEWIQSIGPQNVRKLSVALIVDLLRLEDDPVRASEIATDMTALSEDLLLSGEFDEARNVAAALSDAANNELFVGQAACREALAQVAVSPAMHEMVTILGELDSASLAVFTDMCCITGAATVDVLGMALKVAEKTPARLRASDIIEAIGPSAIAPLAVLLDDERPYVQCNGAEILGRIGSPEAVPVLVALLRRCDLRVTRVAVSALASIRHSSAARAIHTVLRVATGEQRRIVIESLVDGHDVRVIPILVCILNESEPLGRDHDIVLETLAALQVVRSDSAVAPIARVARRRRWFARKRNRALKGTAVDALFSIGTDASTKALVLAAKEGDPLLRRLARAKLAERTS